MISLGTDITLGKGERTIKRHITYAKYSKVNIYMILLSPIKNQNYQKEIIKNNTLYIYPVVCKNHFLLILRGLIKTLLLCSKINVNMIYSQDPFGTAIIANVARKIFRIPLLIGNHSSFANNPIWLAEKPLYFSLLKIIMRINLPLADAWRVNNKKEKDNYIKYYGIDSNRIIVNHTLVNSETFSKSFDSDSINKLKLKISTDPSTKLLIWAGRPVKFKRIDLLLETFAEVLKTKSNTKLILIGEFSQSYLFKKLLQNFDKKYKEKIFIVSKGANHKLLAKFYKVADIYVHTSAYEGFGVVLSEAALSGLPIVCTASDGAEENVEDGKSGYIVKSSSSKELSKKIIKLLNDDELRFNMSNYAKRRALKKYNPKNNLYIRDKLWKNIIKNGINSRKSLLENRNN